MISRDGILSTGPFYSNRPCQGDNREGPYSMKVGRPATSPLLGIVLIFGPYVFTHDVRTDSRQPPVREAGLAAH